MVKGRSHGKEMIDGNVKYWGGRTNNKVYKYA